MAAIGAAFGAVFVAELGDKTQFLAVGFGARHSMRTVLAGLAIGYASAGAVAALVGGVLGATLPERPIGIAAGLLFLLFAALGLRRSDDDEPEHVISSRSAIASIALTIAVGELGDKTQLATAALAARGQPVLTWVGATLGEVAAGMLGAVAGNHLGSRVDRRVLQYASAAMFTVFGIALLVAAL